MDSFITWIGGKKALRRQIVEQFPPQKSFERYIEVFGGAGWILFSSERHAKTEVYNDIDGQLVNLFRCIKYHPDAVQSELDYIMVSREQFFDAKEQINIRGLTDIQRAARFYILIKESYGVDLRSFNAHTKDMLKAKKYLEIISERLKSVIIENLDYQSILHNYDRKETLFYLDPPYYKAENYYCVKFLPEDHIALNTILKDIKGRFILSYNDCTYIRNLYKSFEIIETSRSHNLLKCENGGQKSRYGEILIKNY